jgi:hypothetical protein
MKPLMMFTVFLWSMFLFGQNDVLSGYQLAIISDINSFSEVREDQSVTSPITGTLHQNQFFFVLPDPSNDWWRINNNGEMGYINKSSVQMVKLMNDSALRCMLSDILITQKELLFQMNQVEYGKQDYDYVMKFLNRYHDNRYRVILTLCSDFIIRNKDKDLLSRFIDVLSLSTGSVDETQSYVAASLLFYLYEETIIFVEIKNSAKLIRYLLNSIEFHASGANWEISRTNMIKAKLENLPIRN